MHLEWKDPPPPPRRGRSSTFTLLAEELRLHPGVWAYLGVHGSGYVNYVRRRLGEGFEATSRGIEGQRGRDVYARYVGELAS